MLTPQQQKLLTFLEEYQNTIGRAPNFTEMMAGLGLKSKSSIHRLLEGLAERGYIKRLTNRARAIEILKPSTPASAQASVPFLGRIAAGNPIAAIAETDPSLIDVPNTWLHNNTAHYALEVQGDSMQDEGIMDGDTAIIAHTTAPPPHAIVVALVDDEEVTLKFWQQNHDKITLIPANKTHQPRTFAATTVQFQGQLVGVLRRYH